jgi:hypothetical protein
MYRPSTIAHPLYQRQSSWVGHRALNPDDEILPDVPNIIRKLQVMPQISKLSEDAARMVQECFQLTKVQKRSYKTL